MTSNSQESEHPRAREAGGGIATIVLLLLIAGYVLTLYPGAAREFAHTIALSRPHR